MEKKASNTVKKPATPTMIQTQTRRPQISKRMPETHTRMTQRLTKKKKNLKTGKTLNTVKKVSN